jgi:archaeal flagellin FlaB
VSDLRCVLQDEQGLSAIETAIVLIAFVVVASVFAFTMLSAGMFSTEASKDAIYAGLEEVRSSMELRGSVVITATNTGAEGAVDAIVFTVRTVAGGGALNLADTSDSNNEVVVSYRDSEQMKSGLDWHVTWLGGSDGDHLLEPGELAEITIYGLEALLDPDLGPNTTFAIEVSPPKGAVLVLERTTPPYLDKVMDLR